MHYISTRGQAPRLDFSGVLIAGLADDGGLYVPESWPKVSAEEIRDFAGRPYIEVATNLMARFTAPAISAEELMPLVADAYSDFGHPAVAPLRQLNSSEWILELFHGPTLSFKDYALQVVGRLFDAVLQSKSERVTVVGATSGDTGSAAIEACRNRDTITAFILHPQGRITEVQRRQMTTVRASNIYNIAIDGTFDDCQAIVKKMFGDQSFRARWKLTAVNSINWARVMAQVVYYFTTAAVLGGSHQIPAFSVPTGNFGDAFAGHVARRMGLNISQMVIATNVNDILVRLLELGEYRKGPVHATLSPSIDIQVSSNFERLLFELSSEDGRVVSDLMDQLDNDGVFKMSDAGMALMRGQFDGCSVSEDEMLQCMTQVNDVSGISVDPHTAVGIMAGRSLRRSENCPMVYLSTAHPAKFPDAVERAIGTPSELPARLADLHDRPEEFDVLPNDLASVQAYVAERSRA